MEKQAHLGLWTATSENDLEKIKELQLRESPQISKLSHSVAIFNGRVYFSSKEQMQRWIENSDA